MGLDLEMELKNGELLRAAEENGFDVFVTGDQTLAYEQNLAERRLAILALFANNWPIVKRLRCADSHGDQQRRAGFLPNARLR